MKLALVDTNIVSLFFRNQPLVIENFNAYIKEYGKINISIITYYEIVSGLKHRDAQKQLNVSPTTHRRIFGGFPTPNGRRKPSFTTGLTSHLGVGNTHECACSSSELLVALVLA